MDQNVVTATGNHNETSDDELNAYCRTVCGWFHSHEYFVRTGNITGSQKLKKTICNIK